MSTVSPPGNCMHIYVQLTCQKGWQHLLLDTVLLANTLWNVHENISERVNLSCVISLLTHNIVCPGFPLKGTSTDFFSLARFKGIWFVWFFSSVSLAITFSRFFLLWKQSASHSQTNFSKSTSSPVFPWTGLTPSQTQTNYLKIKSCIRL